MVYWVKEGEKATEIIEHASKLRAPVTLIMPWLNGAGYHQMISLGDLEKLL